MVNRDILCKIRSLEMARQTEAIRAAYQRKLDETEGKIKLVIEKELTEAAMNGASRHAFYTNEIEQVDLNRIIMKLLAGTGLTVYNGDRVHDKGYPVFISWSDREILSLTMKIA